MILFLGSGHLNNLAAAAAAKSLQSCPTLCDPIDSSPPGSPVPGILQARTLEWVAIAFSNTWKWKVKWSRSVVSDSSRPHGLQPTGLLRPWDFPGKGTGVGCHCLLRDNLANLSYFWKKTVRCREFNWVPRDSFKGKSRTRVPLFWPHSLCYYKPTLLPCFWKIYSKTRETDRLHSFLDIKEKHLWIILQRF